MVHDPDKRIGNRPVRTAAKHEMGISERQIGIENTHLLSGAVKGKGQVDGKICLSDPAFTARDGCSLRTFHTQFR